MNSELIVDIFVQNNDPDVVVALLDRAYLYARNSGSHVLELMGFPKDIRATVLRNQPYSRMAPNWPYYYLSHDIDLQTNLNHGEAWYACPFDGDASL